VRADVKLIKASSKQQAATQIFSNQLNFEIESHDCQAVFHLVALSDHKLGACDVGWDALLQVEAGALDTLADLVRVYVAKQFLLCHPNSYFTSLAGAAHVFPKRLSTAPVSQELERPPPRAGGGENALRRSSFISHLQLIVQYGRILHSLSCVR
jgi:hypothetical protein